ncbi:hypothetical protein HAHE_11250 [Haloferula helveola]|uniref:Pyrrolo-quinoline quinone repeat domain-containing protein n=1 Tax=Haloferula helveola TaxID=490095 RepID=A0ABM7R896_9BACT|nr:hypothetical protein HAHE_11250 [Haloferula helveola]
MKTCLLPLSAAAFLLLPAAASDWPRYLGPDGAAKVEGELGASVEPEVLWKADVGKGCSGFVIVGDRAIVPGNQGDKDIIWCFEASTGKVLWKHEYPEELNPKLYAGGPNVTPTVVGDRVYTLSRTGNLFCLSLTDGSVKWHKHYQTDFGGKDPSWGYSAAPVVWNDWLYCLPCSGDAAVYALDAKTGEVKSRFGGKTKPGYATPVFFEHKGKKAMGAFHGREFIAYDLATGDELFDFGWRTSYDVNASNPQYLDGKLFLASGYGMGYVVVDVSGAEPKVLHKEEDTRMIFQNSILQDGDIVGVFGDKNIDAELIRMDMASGKIHWRQGMPGTRGSSLMVGDSIVVLAETGDLVVGKPAREGWKESGRAKVLSGKCWAPVAYANGRVFAKTNEGQAVCVSVK